MQNHLDAIIIMMRTTVNLPDDVYEAARSVAASKRLSLGEALAHLVRQGLNPPVEIDAEKAFPILRCAERRRADHFAADSSRRG